MIPQDNRQEAVEVLDFLRTLEDGEKKDMLNVLQGIRIGIQIGREMEAGTAVAGEGRAAGMAEIEVKGTFDAQAFFTALAAILSKREQVKITVTVAEKDRPVEPVRAAG